MKKAGISIPVANERDSIEQFLSELTEELSPLEYDFSVYIVMDDFSRDGTLDIVREMSERENPIRLVYYKESTGVASCYLRGFKEALNDGCDFIIEMDSGGSHPPSYIAEILRALDDQGYEAVFMTRFGSGGGVENFPISRRFVSLGGSIVANMWLGTSLSDMTSGFEAFRADVLRKMNLDAFLATGGIYQTEMKYYCKDLKIKQIPFVYQASATSFRLKWIIEAFRVLFAMKRNRRRVLAEQR